ncbi:MAG: hypothetical protein RLP15_08125 [Cryomorphaceae bacterium]
MQNEEKMDQLIRAALPTERPSPSFVQNVMSKIEAEPVYEAKSPRISSPEVFGLVIVVTLACFALVLAAERASPFESVNNLFNSAWFNLFESPLYAVGLFILSAILLIDKLLNKARWLWA